MNIVSGTSQQEEYGLLKASMQRVISPEMGQRNSVYQPKGDAWGEIKALLKGCVRPFKCLAEYLQANTLHLLFVFESELHIVF